MAVKITVYGTADMRQIERAQKQLTRLADEARKTSTGFASSMGTLGASMSKVGTNMMDTGKTLTRNVTLPIVGIGAVAVKTAADFEVSMNSLQVNAQASATEMKSMSALAIKMGQDTVFSAGEAANAMLELSKGGLSVASIQGGALASTLNLAATEGMGLADAATIVVQSMNTFGISADRTGQVVDILAAGAVASTAGVQDLADGMKYVGATSAQMKIGIADVVTSLAAMNNAGIDSTTAGTSLNRMLLGLAGTTKKGAGVIKQYGLDFYDANGKVKPMVQIVGELQRAFGKMDSKTRTIKLKDLFGVEGMRAANILISEGVKGYKELSAAVNKEGIAQQMADARMKGTAGALEQLKGSLETAGIAIGQALAPTVNSLAKTLTNLTNKFASLPAGTQQAIVALGAVAAAIGPVVFLLGGMVRGIGGTISAVGSMASATKTGVVTLLQFKDGLTQAIATQSAFVTPAARAGQAVRVAAFAVADYTKALWASIVAGIKATGTWIKDTAAKIANTAATVANTVATKAAAAASKAWAAVQWLLNAALSANPIGLVVVAVGALVAAFVLAYKRSETFRNIVNGAFNAVKAAGQALWSFFSNFGSRFLGVGKAIVEGIWKGISSAGGWLLDRIKGWGSGVLNSIKDVFGIASPSKKTAEMGRQLSLGLAKGMLSASKKVLSASEQMLDDLKKSIQNSIDDMKSSMADTGDRITYALNAARDAANKMVDDAKDAWSTAGDKLRDLQDQSTSFAASIRDSLRSVFSLKDALNTDNGKSFLGNLRQQLKDMTTFAGQVRQLRTLGLNEASMTEIIQAGVAQGTEIAAAILTGGAGAVAEINQLESMITDQAQSLGNLFAQDKFGAELSKAQQNLNMAAQSLASATASRDVLVAKINAAQAGVDAVLGRSMDNLDRLVNNLVNGVGGVADVISQLLGDVAAKTTMLEVQQRYVQGLQQSLSTLKSGGNTSTKNIKVESGAVQVTVGAYGDDRRQAIETKRATEQAFDQLLKELAAK